MPQSFSAFYSAHGMRANAFLPQGFGSPEDRHARVASAARRGVSPQLLAVLEAQNDALPESSGRDAQLLALARPGTAVVATGQQVGLFLGPLYSVFKAATAVVIARALTAETGVRCVPLFWLQTEDHDFAEIASCSVPLDEGQPLELALHDDPQSARRSIGDRILGADVASLVDRLDTELAAQPYSAEVLRLLREHYRPGTSPGRAFAGVLSEIFAEDGLIVLDPRCPEIARLAAPVLRTALEDAPRLESILAQRSQTLEASGFAEQIQLRPGSPLAFFHLTDRTGPRYRLSRRGDSYGVPGSDEPFADRELAATLEADPLRFSTSALLRPILQDTLLPTAVYVGGAAEVSYFAQLAPLYSAFGLEPPLVAERAHLRLVTPRVRSLLHKLGLTCADLDLPPETLLRKLSTSTGSSPGPAWLAELEGRLDTLVAEAPTLDPTLTKAVERTRGSVRHALERLTRKHQRTVLARDAVLASRLGRVETWLRPGGDLQERVHSFPAFAAKVGLARFREVIVSAIDPFNPSMREVEL